ncbi:hypothetical protein EG329_007534 [Mollisiaceae sp. DMI_Dod_QoI]|nr:hypothetical protein EG329_007534 [Helotiales sp. DMI_Dod_QoI]
MSRPSRIYDESAPHSEYDKSSTMFIMCRAEHSVDGMERHPHISLQLLFDKKSPHNRKWYLSSTEPQTIECGNIHTIILALWIFHKRLMSPSIRRVVLVTESAYVPHVMQNWIWIWVANGMKDSLGQPIAYGEAFWNLHNLMWSFEEKGIAIQLWQYRP